MAWTKLCAALLVLRTGAYQAGERPVLGTNAPPTTSRKPQAFSVAQRTEQQSRLGVTIKYLAPLAERLGISFAERQRRKTSSEDDAYWEHKDGKWEFGEWVDGEWKADKSAGDMPPWLKAEMNPDGSLKKPEELRPIVGGGLKRCGFTWDDAAAKVSTTCTTDSDCVRPDDSFGLWPASANYSCFADVPNYERGEQGECVSAEPKMISDIYCQQVCGAYPGAWCDPEKCNCIKNSQAWNLSAPIQALDHEGRAEDLPNKTKAMIQDVHREWDAMPSGLPACPWRPPHRGCRNTSQYECTEGPEAGKCSAENWYGKSAQCTHSCVHVRLLKPAPYYALWIPGVKAGPYMIGERHPRYQHDASKLTPEARGLNLYESDVLMSRLCHSETNKFVGITLYSPMYEAKASRLVRSCERVGICCKATQLPPNAFGPDQPEGSEEFRFQTIAMKPSFILSQLQATALPVVFLDTDLEFHRFPNLFMPGSWPDFDRDVLLFNYWGNETLPQTKNRPNIGSAVAFFNATNRSRAILNAWAQAMSWDTNQRAPDDQVRGLNPNRPLPALPERPSPRFAAHASLGSSNAYVPATVASPGTACSSQVLDLLLSQGEWLKRASFGWLPSSYLRTMPSYYRGVVPVIDHDHGSAPGILKHSESKPKYPPVLDMELCEWWNETNKGRPRYMSVEETQKEVQDDAYTQLLCSTHGLCDGQTSWWNPNPAPQQVPQVPYAPSGAAPSESAGGGT